MDRNMVIETAYEAIKDSLEWTDNYKSDGNGVDSYSNYIDGIVTMTENILNKLENEKEDRLARPIKEQQFDQILQIERGSMVIKYENLGR